MAMFDFLNDLYDDTVGQIMPGTIRREVKEGQARDEARQIRADDISREDKNIERQSLSGRITEGAKHGLSKLASIGASPSSAFSTSVGQDTGYLNINSGQNAISSSERSVNRLQADLLRAQTRGVELDNLEKTQLLEKKPKTGVVEPGSNFMPGGSQSVRGGISEKPMERTASYPGSPHMEPGSVTGSGFESTPTGLAPVPSSDVKQRIEDSPYELRHFYRYGILPNLGDRSTTPPRLPEMVKREEVWVWSKKAQEWQIKSMYYNDDDTWLDRKFKKFINWKGE